MDIKITCLTSAEDLSLDKLIDEHKKVIIGTWHRREALAAKSTPNRELYN